MDSTPSESVKIPFDDHDRNTQPPIQPNCEKQGNCCMFCSFSSKIWSDMKRGIVISLLFNIIYCLIWKNKVSFASILLYAILLHFIVAARAMAMNKEPKNNMHEKFAKMGGECGKKIDDYIKRISSLNEPTETVKFFGICIVLYKIFGIVSDYFVFWVALNFILFSHFIMKNKDTIFQKVILPVIQTYQGVTGIISALIPAYKDPEVNNEKKTN